jgi:DNA-binding GntR family transcriptional regulator
VTSAAEAPVRRESLTEQAAKRIREAILVGDYKQGEKITEAKLVRRFGVSHSVVREALHILQGEGIVVAKTYCGRSVFKLTKEEAHELMVLRASLESYAAYLAAEKLTGEWAQKVSEATSQMLAGPPNGFGDWVERELNFHRTIWQASGNQWLVRQLSQFVVLTFAGSTLDLFQVDFDCQHVWEAACSWEETHPERGYQLVTRAILARDANGARDLMIRHILAAPSSLCNLRRKVFGF